MAAEAGGRSGDAQTLKGEPTGSEDESEAVCERREESKHIPRFPSSPERDKGSEGKAGGKHLISLCPLTTQHMKEAVQGQCSHFYKCRNKA